MYVDLFPGPGWLVKTSGYGQRVDPLGRGAGFHGGMDWGSPNPAVNPICGAEIYAPFPTNKITTGFEGGGAGNWIWCEAGDGRLFKAFHLTSYAVRGGTVPMGTVIGYTGTTGASTGCHNHWELWENGVRLDPEPHLNDAKRRAGGNPPSTPTPTKEWDDMASKDEVKAALKELIMDDPDVGAQIAYWVLRARAEGQPKAVEKGLPDVEGFINDVGHQVLGHGPAKPAPDEPTLADMRDRQATAGSFPR